MDTLEWTTEDKTGWGEGPWMAEPDKMQWLDETTGMPCLILRNHGGALCGYVGVTADHPWHGIDYGDSFGCTADCEREWCYEHTPGGVADVHGGLTYANACQPGSDHSTSICHIPGPGEPDNVWWFGFDCSHFQDLGPASAKMYRDIGLPDSPCGEVYRDVPYVRAEVVSLAAQLAEVK